VNRYSEFQSNLKLFEAAPETDAFKRALLGEFGLSIACARVNNA